MRNKGAKRLYDIQWAIKNRQRISDRKRSYYKTHIDQKRKASRKWYENNREKVYATRCERRCVELMSQPPWVKRDDLVRFYIEAKKKTLTTGIRHDVDHIWPLKGIGFIGLNVPWNLRVITHTENVRKYNKRPVELSECL